jgi:outer membrane protein assembly factor BamA
MVLYRPPSAPEEDGVWASGVAAFVAESDSWGAGLFHKMSLQKDTWRVVAAYAYADLRYDFYGIGEGSDKLFIPIRQDAHFTYAEALYQLFPDWYFGLSASHTNTTAGLAIPDFDLPPGFPTPPSLSKEFNFFNLNPTLLYDTRNEEFYPTSGTLLKAKARMEVSDENFVIYELGANHYRELFEDSGILAFRLALKFADGDVPFFNYPAFGSGADLRGYQTGVYRDRFLIAAQGEYRHHFTNRIGGVAFAGVGTVHPDFAGWGETLPSIGFGLRYLIAKDNQMNLRMDFAWGKDDFQFYFGIGEAF